MNTTGKIMLGLFIGVLCGLIPFIYGILLSHRKLAVAGLLASIAAGVFFSLTDKSPFTAMAVSSIFAIFIYASIRRSDEQKRDDGDD